LFANHPQNKPRQGRAQRVHLSLDGVCFVDTLSERRERDTPPVSERGSKTAKNAIKSFEPTPSYETGGEDGFLSHHSPQIF